MLKQDGIETAIVERKIQRTGNLEEPPLALSRALRQVTSILVDAPT